jgi:hypothetical protein
MSLLYACDVGLARDFDVLASLANVNTIKAVEVHYLSNLINRTLRHRRIGTRDSEVVDLSVQKDDLPADLTSLVCGVHVIEIVENLVGVFFPQCTGFRMSLQGLEYW